MTPHRPWGLARARAMPLFVELMLPNLQDTVLIHRVITHRLEVAAFGPRTAENGGVHVQATIAYTQS
jgi:hypothetical protein